MKGNKVMGDKDRALPSAMPWDEEIAFILGRPGFMFIREAELFRSLGYDIPKRAEDEQAFFIHRWLHFYFMHGAEWRDRANADIRAHIELARDAVHEVNAPQ